MGRFEDELAELLPRGVPGRADRKVGAEWLDMAAVRADRAEWSRWRHEAGRVFLGSWNGEEIGVADNRHVVTVAGSRAGKGVSLIVPNLLRYEGSVIAIDPKGELAEETALQRSRAAPGLAQKVHVLDPFGANRIWPTSRYNPLAELDAGKPRVIDDVDRLADALIVDEGKDPHWPNSARMLVHALMLYALWAVPQRASLVDVRDLLMGRDPALALLAENTTKGDRGAALFRLLAGCKSPVFGDLVASVGDSFARMAENERANIISTARTQTRFLDSEGLRQVVREHDFALGELRSCATTVYLCLPASHMGSHAKWLRLMITMSLQAMEDAGLAEEKAPPVLFVLDEMHVLGHMKQLETAAGLIAGFGVRLWTVLQDLSQLQRNYRHSWETFMGNAGVLTFFGNTDMTTLKYVSDKLGQRSQLVRAPNERSVQAVLAGQHGTREELRDAPLLASHEIEQILARERRAMLVLVAGSKPVILRRAVKFEAPFEALRDRTGER